jgi:molybdopterin-guanine dinucleotide biosynthesis protein
MSAESGREAARVLLVGGQSRNVGKTALVVDLIRALPEAGWLAMKITQYGHGVCAVAGGECDCAPQEHAVALDEETDAGGRSDTSRFLAAGARRALWLRTKEGRLAEALPLLRRELGRRDAGAAANVIVESNSLRGLLEPRLYLVVLDPAVEDFKQSARRFLDCADAFVLRRQPQGEWPAVGKQFLERRPVFVQGVGEAVPEGLTKFVREGFFGCAGMAHGAAWRTVSS